MVRDLNIAKGKEIPLNSFEAWIQPSIKGNKGAINTDKLKNGKELI